jgi:DNA-binding transcriptional LysR family regulator
MELRQLRYVVAVEEEGSFTRAAARVHVAQPAISQQIAQLERELGERLFDRSERRVRLTVAGEAFLPHARAVLEATTAARDAVESLRGELAGELTIGTIPSPAPVLMRRLGELQRQHPKLRLTIRTGDPEGLATAVATGALDAAVIGVAGGRLPAGPGGQRLPSVLASQTIATEPLVVAVAPDHPLAQSPGIALADLRDEPLLTLTHGRGLRTVLEAACAEAGFAPRIHAETDDLVVLADLVGHGFGVALIPRSAAERALQPLVMLPLRKPRLRREMVLVWHRHQLSAPAQAFLTSIAAHDDADPTDPVDPA